MDGSKNKPCIIFKGKGRVSEAQELQNRDDILVFFPQNGWMNTDLTKRWINKVFPQDETQKSLLIRDSFTCHTDQLTKELLNNKNIL